MSGPAFQRVTTDPARRAGFLTQAGVLASLAGFDQTSPVLRGTYVRERLLCAEMPPRPPTVANAPSPPSATRTTRGRASAHASDPSCAGCHRPIDPIGFGFEGYDAVGLYRATEAGKPVNDAGEAAESDVGRFAGAVELGIKLAASAQLRACVVRQWFHFASGRLEGAADQATLAALDATLQGGGRLRDLLLAIVQSESFLHLRRKGG